MISIYLLQLFLAGVSGHHEPLVISIYLLQIFLAGVSGHHGPPVISIFFITDIPSWGEWSPWTSCN